MTYVEHLNALIRAKAASKERLVMLGQNIAAGSCLSGLTRGLVSEGGRHVINTPNSENTIVGTGFGLALSGVDAINADQVDNAAGVIKHGNTAHFEPYHFIQQMEAVDFGRRR